MNTYLDIKEELKTNEDLFNISSAFIKHIYEIAIKMNENMSFTEYTKINNLSKMNLFSKLNYEIENEPHAILDFVEASINLEKSKTINAVFLVEILNYLAIKYPELKKKSEFLSYKLKFLSYNSKIKPKKYDIIKYKILELFENNEKILSKFKLISILKNELQRKNYELSSRSIEALIERQEAVVYFFKKDFYILIDESSYPEDITKIFISIVEEEIQKKLIIATNFFKKDFFNLFLNASIECKSQYFIHSFIRKKSKLFDIKTIGFSRMPILTIKTKEKDLPIKMFWITILQKNIFCETSVETIIQTFKKNYGFDDLYTKNILSQLNNPKYGNKILNIEKGNVIPLWI